MKEGDEMAIIVGCATIVWSKGSSKGNCKLSCYRLSGREATDFAMLINLDFNLQNICDSIFSLSQSWRKRKSGTYLTLNKDHRRAIVNIKQLIFNRPGVAGTVL